MMNVNNRSSYPIPPARAPLPDSVFHQYHKEEMTMFVPMDVTQFLDTEIKAKKGENIAPDELEYIRGRRELYKKIPQLTKEKVHYLDNGEMIRTQVIYNNPGVYLTVDVIMGYFEEITNPAGETKDLLHVILLWSKGDPKNGDAPGWVLPGKRDQAYDDLNPDMSLREASLSLVKKEAHLDISDVEYYANIAFFDDRIREERFKASGCVSVVLLKKKPILEPGKMIGVPLNGVKLLAERRVAIAPFPEEGQGFPMARNHDSLISAVFKTAAFSRTMEKMKRNQALFRVALRENPGAKRPPFSANDPLHECIQCFELLVGARVICQGGHTLCGICLPLIKQANLPCPECRGELLKEPIRNLALEHIVEYMNPREYRERYASLNAGPVTKNWEDDPAFCGTHIMYRG